MPLLNSILEIHNLSSGAHRALIGLLSFRNKANGQCNPKMETLGERLGGIPERTLRRWLHELRLAGVVYATKHRGSNSYRINISTDCEKPAVENAQDRPKVAAQDRPKMAGLNARILTEQTVLNRQRGTAAADVHAIRVEKAAAAALPLFDEIETPTPQAEAEKLVAELMPQHPEPGNLPKAINEAAKLLASRPETLTATIETLRRNHGLWRARWATYAAGRFVPQLWRWFHDGDWEHPPVDRKPVQSETWHERHERERKESDEENYRRYAELGMWSALREYGGDALVEVWREKVKAVG